MVLPVQFCRTPASVEHVQPMLTARMSDNWCLLQLSLQIADDKSCGNSNLILPLLLVTLMVHGKDQQPVSLLITTESTCVLIPQHIAHPHSGATRVHHQQLMFCTPCGKCSTGDGSMLRVGGLIDMNG
jgi:hypothetical protein